MSNLYQIARNESKGEKHPTSSRMAPANVPDHHHQHHRVEEDAGAATYDTKETREKLQVAPATRPPSLLSIRPETKSRKKLQLAPALLPPPLSSISDTPPYRVERQDELLPQEPGAVQVPGCRTEGGTQEDYVSIFVNETTATTSNRPDQEEEGIHPDSEEEQELYNTEELIRAELVDRTREEEQIREQVRRTEADHIREKVQEEIRASAPMATAVSDTEQTRQRRRQRIITLSVVLLVVLISVILAIVLAKEDSSTSSSTPPPPPMIPAIWNQLGDDIDGEAAGDWFGNSISLSSDGLTVAIGGTRNDGGADRAGHVRVHRYQGVKWIQVGQDIDGDNVNDLTVSGVSLSDDGMMVAVGAAGANAGFGRVRVYGLADENVWTQVGGDLEGKAEFENFGVSVSLSAGGNFLAVGAVQLEADSKSGYVRLFEFVAGSSWVQVGQDIVGEAGRDEFGRSISLSADGKTIAVGAHRNDGNGDDAGHVRVYNLQGSSWIQTGNDIDGEAAHDSFGYSVSLSAEVMSVAIGAPLTDGNGINNSGRVRVYKFNGDSWAQTGQDINGAFAGDHFGYSVALSGSGEFLAVGAIQQPDNGSSKGYARVFQMIEGSWTQLGYDFVGEAAGDGFGVRISLSSDGTVVGISGIGNDDDAGHVRIYKLEAEAPPIPGNWSQLGQVIHGEAAGDWSGNSISLSSDGNTVAIGAVGNDGNGYDSGHVRVHHLQGTSWVQVGQDLDGEAADDQAGRALALSSDGTRVAVGAWGNDNENGWNVGHARVYDLAGGTWTQIGQDIDGGAPGDQFGLSLSLSDDGQILAVGANQYTEDESKPGYVRVFELVGSLWVQLGEDIEGEAAGDDFGGSISLSADGKTVAIGAQDGDDNGSNSGHVQIHHLEGDLWTKLGQDIVGKSPHSKSGRSVSLSGSGTRVAIGAPKNGPQVNGQAVVYDLLDGAWTQIGQDIDGAYQYGFFGWSVSLSGDGQLLAVGGFRSFQNSEDDISYVSCVRVFQLNEESWVQVGQDIIGEVSDELGQSISLSADGGTVAIGADTNDGNGDDSGDARIYRLIQ